MTDETRAPLPESQPPTGETPTVRAEAVIAAAERVSHLPSELCDFIREQARELAEAKQQRANTFADLLAEEEKVGELQAAASQSASGINWQHFDAAYAKACESSEPKDWMQAALFAQQVRNAVSTTQPSEPVTQDGPLGGWSPVGEAASELDLKLTLFQAELEAIAELDPHNSAEQDDYNHHFDQASAIRREIVEKYTPRSATGRGIDG